MGDVGAVKATIRTGARRDFDALERRRKQAAAMFRRGKTQADVVHELGVSRQSASRWHADWSKGGAEALDAAGRAGRLPLLDATDWAKIEKQLLKGALANGFPTDLWTIERVGQVIESVSGVDYHPGHVWRLLRQMGWSRQRPARRAKEANREAIEEWVKVDWPRVKKTPDAGTRGSVSKTRAASASSPR